MVAHLKAIVVFFTFRVFEDSERRKAESSRLDIELDLNRRGVDHEVVLLEAASEAALRRTHRRYFGDFSQILESASGHDDLTGAN